MVQKRAQEGMENCVTALMKITGIILAAPFYWKRVGGDRHTHPSVWEGGSRPLPRRAKQIR